MNLAFTAIGTGIGMFATNHVIHGVLPTPNLVEGVQNVFKQIAENTIPNASKLAARTAAGTQISFDEKGNPVAYIPNGEETGFLNTADIANRINGGRVENVVAVNTENLKENAVTAGASAVVLGGLSLAAKVTGVSWLPGLTILAAPAFRALTYINGDLKVLSAIIAAKEGLTNPMDSNSLIGNPLVPAITALGIEDNKVAQYLIETPAEKILQDFKGNGGAAVRNGILGKAIGAAEGIKVGLKNSILSPFGNLAEAGQNVLASFIVRPDNIATA